MLQILSDPAYSLNIIYLEGSVLNQKDIVRARADAALGIFIMCNKNSDSSDLEDSTTILQHFSLRRYLAQVNASPLVCLQLIRVESRRHLANENNSSHLIICFSEMKMGLLAKTCLHPGSSTLLFNLLASFSDDQEEEEDIEKKGMIKQGNDIIDTLANTVTDNWEAEYTKGCDWEVYISSLPKDFEGLKFCNLSYTLYHKTGIVLIGLRVEEIRSKSQERLLLNPGSMVIPSSDEFIIEAIVIAKDQESSDLTFSDDPGILSQIVLNARTEASRAQNLESGRMNTMAEKPVEELKKGTSIFVGNVKSVNERSLDHRKLSGSRRRASAENFMTILLKRSGNAELQHHLSKKEKFLKGKVVGSKSRNGIGFMGGINSYVSDQEKKEHEADRYLERNYFRRSYPADIADVLVNTSLADEFPLVDIHS
jgi:hypothetical protein